MTSTNRLTPESLQAQLADLECRYGFSSAEFIERYHVGAMGDSREVMHWAWLCSVAAKLGLLAIRDQRTA